MPAKYNACVEVVWEGWPAAFQVTATDGIDCKGNASLRLF